MCRSEGASHNVKVFVMLEMCTVSCCLDSRVILAIAASRVESLYKSTRLSTRNSMRFLEGSGVWVEGDAEELMLGNIISH